MELRELAERILFATSLEEKLQPPDVLTDDRPGPASDVPKEPGRPPELQFKSVIQDRAEVPTLSRLHQERERGRLLHFFANHELLATELMALVLLRFPDAPAAFRRGVAQTLQDEQAHTRLYLQRMQECGVQFGELPVSGFFWKAISSMENPMDYVAGLSLTFEQANLDFCQHFARGFRAAGDSITAGLLEGICRDEIGHVAYGLNWFRRWKDPALSDWEAFRRQLKSPLSPRRAKGFDLNVADRRAAGLDAEFIAELDVYAHSKGRTPSVFVFNPFSEGFIARGPSFTPVKEQQQLARDLQNLPQFLAREDDVVLVQARPRVEFLAQLKRSGLALPEFRTFDHGRLGPETLSAHQKIGRLRPWAWGPDSVKLLEPLFDLVTGERRQASEYFNAGIAELYSKVWSAEFLRGFLREYQALATRDAAHAERRGSWFCSLDDVGQRATSLEEALSLVERTRQRGHHRIVVKAEFGLAGQNAIRLWEPAVLEAQRRWIADATASGRSVVVEPWLAREFDFSMQFEMGTEGLKLRGYAGLLTDQRGQFLGNSASPSFARHLPARVLGLLRVHQPHGPPLQAAFERLFALLELELRKRRYFGPLGIDAFVYREASGQTRIKPVVEINPRFTMGRLTLELMRQTCPGSSGRLRLMNRAALGVLEMADFQSVADDLASRAPLVLEGSPVPRIREGALCLNDPREAKASLAVFEVTRGECSGVLFAGLNTAS